MLFQTVSSAMLNNTSKDSINSPNSMISTKEAMAQKFTTSNFTESVVINSDPVFGGDGPNNTSTGKNLTSPQNTIGPQTSIASTSNSSSAGGTTISVAKKRKVDASKGIMQSSSSTTDEINK